MTGKSPDQRAAACASVEECDGMARQAQDMLRRSDADHAYWEAIRLAALTRRRELEQRS